MSDHSKWATTKHKKAAIDAKRAKAFARYIKRIEVAAHEQRRRRFGIVQERGRVARITEGDDRHPGTLARGRGLLDRRPPYRCSQRVEGRRRQAAHGHRMQLCATPEPLDGIERLVVGEQ